jgi:pyridoxal phosphate enzyme (YggS family)
MHSKDLISIKSRYQAVLEDISKSALSVERDPENVHLVVVTKGQEQQTIENVILAGAKRIAENYVEEAEIKKGLLNSYDEVEWHMIGHIQSRKAKKVCELFDWVQSIDSVNLADRLSRFAVIQNKKIPVLLECNVSGEQSKFGFQAWEEKEWDKLLVKFQELTTLNGIEIKGFMCIPPYFEDVSLTRPYFQKLARLQQFARENLECAEWKELSMGMSADYKIAVEEGATIVRIGTAITGPREVK